MEQERRGRVGGGGGEGRRGRKGGGEGDKEKDGGEEDLNVKASVKILYSIFNNYS